MADEQQNLVQRFRIIEILYQVCQGKVRKAS